MAVSSIKGCWYKFSARIRDYLDVVDSYYRPACDLHDQGDEHVANNQRVNVNNHHHHRSNCCQDKSSSAKDHSKRSGGKSSHRHHHHHHRCSEQARSCLNSRPQLPPGYTKRKTTQGQVYFMDPNGQKYWFDPSVPKELLSASLNLDSLIGRLSSNWEVRQAPSGKTYYVNHTKKTTQFTDPRLVAYKDRLMSILKREQCSNGVNSRANHSELAIGASGRPIVLNNSSSLASADFNPTLNTGTQSSTRYQNNFCQSLSPNHLQSHHQHRSIQNSQAHNNSNPSKPAVSASLRRRFDALVSDSRRNSNDPNNQYNLNLLSGSHHNLSTTTNHSNTLTGPPPAWIKPSSMAGLRKALVNNNSNNYASNTSQQDASSTNTGARLIYDSIDRSGSISNLFPLSANMSRELELSPMQHGYHKSNKELFDKISILRQELLKQQVNPHPCRIEVNRKRIFEESFRIISQTQPKDLRRRLLIKFRGEEGLDYGGVAREWFYLLSREILNPIHGLFQYTSDDIYNLQINPDSGIVYREHLCYMNFCGRVIGMAVFHGHFIEGRFTLPFYKMLLGKPITLCDIEFVDPELHRSLCWILENDITNVIDTTFLIQHSAFGQLQDHELKENGRNINLTEANKQEYVSLYVNYRCRRGIEHQFEALQRGFYELISPSLIENFDEHELELLIGGLSTIDMEDWRLHTKLKNCTVETPLVRWFWEIVKSYSEDKRARLLQFVTGSPRVPIQGFKALQGVNSELRLFTIHLIKNACTDNLPKSHTCFNRIDLPPYENYEKLRDKLTQAIEETMGFAMQ